MVDFSNMDIEGLKTGYAVEADGYSCLHCKARFEAGEIYQIENRFFDSLHAVKMHIKSEHPKRFVEIINSKSKYLTLTDNQRELVELFYNGLTDNEIAKKLEVSPSTVRHQRFVFREKAKAAKLFLGVWEMVEANKSRQSPLIGLHGGATMVDDRYVITNEENEKILSDVFESLNPLKLKIFSVKEKKKIVTLKKISEQFERDKRYTEKEINGIIKEIYSDYVTIRRYLIEYGYMDRTKDCSEYWMV